MLGAIEPMLVSNEWVVYRLGRIEYFFSTISPLVNEWNVGMSELLKNESLGYMIGFPR